MSMGLNYTIITTLGSIGYFSVLFKIEFMYAIMQGYLLKIDVEVLTVARPCFRKFGMSPKSKVNHSYDYEQLSSQYNRSVKSRTLVVGAVSLSLLTVAMFL